MYCCIAQKIVDTQGKKLIMLVMMQRNMTCLRFPVSSQMVALYQRLVTITELNSERENVCYA